MLRHCGFTGRVVLQVAFETTYSWQEKGAPKSPISLMIVSITFIVPTTIVMRVNPISRCAPTISYLREQNICAGRVVARDQLSKTLPNLKISTLPLNKLTMANHPGFGGTLGSIQHRPLAAIVSSPTQTDFDEARSKDYTLWTTQLWQFFQGRYLHQAGCHPSSVELLNM